MGVYCRGYRGGDQRHDLMYQESLLKEINGIFGWDIGFIYIELSRVYGVASQN